MGVGLLVCVSVAQATEPFAQGRVYGATWLVFPRGVRNIGMGATGTSDVSGLSTGYFNPAGVAWSDATTFFGSYEDMFVSLSISEMVIASPFPFHTDSTASAWHFGGSVGYARLDMEPQTERTVFLPEGTGRTFDPTDWMLSASAAASWTRGSVSLGAGGATRFIQQDYGDDVTMWAFDLGLIAAFPMHVGGGMVRPCLGYAALNLDDGASSDGRTLYIATEQRGGFGLDFATPPTLAWGRSVPAVSFSLDYDRIDREHYASPEYSAGFEVSVIDFMHFRYGVIDNDFDTYGLGLGWDYGNVLFRVDYAHVEAQEVWLPGLDLDRDTFGALVGVRW